MAAANPQPHITLNPFRGKPDEISQASRVYSEA